MKKNSVYFVTSTLLIISIILSILTINLTREQIENLPLFDLYLIDMIFFFMTSIFISASLILVSRNRIEGIIRKIFFTLLIAIISSFAYFVLVAFSFTRYGSGESGMIGQAIVAVGGSMIVFIIATIVSFITFLFAKPRMRIIDENGFIKHK